MKLGKFTFVWIVIMLCGLFVAGMGVYMLAGINGSLLELNGATANDLANGTFVEIDVDAAYYSYCEEKGVISVFPYSSSEYYLTDLYLENEYYFLGIKVSGSQRDVMATLSDYSAGFDVENLGAQHCVGILRTNTDSLISYLQEYLYDMYATLDLSNDELSEMYNSICDYYVDVITTGECVFYICSGILLILIGAGFIMHSRKKNTSTSASEPDDSPNIS